MTSQGRATIALIWGAFVTAVLVAVPLTLRGRLPDPLATHWERGGIPDGHMSFGASLLFILLIWGVTWLVLLGLAFRGTALSTRLGRAYWCGVLFGWSVLVLGLQASTLSANLDVTDWRRAVLPVWQVVTVTGCATVAGVLAGLLGRGGPDPRRNPSTPPAMRLRPGQRAVWVSRTTNPWLVGLCVAALTGAVVLTVLAATGALPGAARWTGLVVLVPLVVLGLGTSSIGVRIDADGLRVGFGPLGRPAWRVPVAEIESAWVETRSPMEVGGWGLRGLPGVGRTTLMLRGGECLVIRRATGAEFAISIDDAEHGAALLNAYVAETVGS